MNLQISSGKFKGAKIVVPSSAKPVRSRVKQSIFSILDEDVKNVDCLDLFAGSGALGFEAISLGAKSCDFVDDDYEAIGSIRANIDNLLNKYEVSAEMLQYKDEATKFVANAHEPYGLILMDPPYDARILHLLKLVERIMSDRAKLVFLHNSKSHHDWSVINPTLKVDDVRKYGITTVEFLSKK